MKEPESMDECVYFTRRVLEGGKGKAMAWVFKKECPKCGKEKMGKPQEEGHIKIRAKEYVCPACGYTAEKDEYEDTLECNIKYTCPKCGKEGETSVPFMRKSFQGVKAVIFQCKSCSEKLGITKKLADPKKKKGKAAEESTIEEDE